jgi:hypothetical protein
MDNNNSPKIEEKLDFDVQIKIFRPAPGEMYNEQEINDFLKTVVPISKLTFENGQLIVTYRAKEVKKTIHDMTAEEVKKAEETAISDTILAFKDQHIQNNVANRFNIIKYGAEVELLKGKLESCDKALEICEDKKQKYSLEKERKELVKDLADAEKRLDAGNEAFEANQRHIDVCDQFILKFVKK